MYQTLSSIRNQINFDHNTNFNHHPYVTPVNVYHPVPNRQPVTTVKQMSERPTSVSPRVWGRPLWFSLHYGALNYPHDVDDEKKQMMINFILGLPMMIPCDMCKNHAHEYIQSRKHTLHNVVQNTHNLFTFFWEFHNDVNKRNGKPLMSLEAVYHLYKTNPSGAL